MKKKENTYSLGLTEEELYKLNELKQDLIRYNFYLNSPNMISQGRIVIDEPGTYESKSSTSFCLTTRFILDFLKSRKKYAEREIKELNKLNE